MAVANLPPKAEGLLPKVSYPTLCSLRRNKCSNTDGAMHRVRRRCLVQRARDSEDDRSGLTKWE
jgi:hypothetical protein